MPANLRTGKRSEFSWARRLRRAAGRDGETFAKGSVAAIVDGHVRENQRRDGMTRPFQEIDAPGLGVRGKRDVVDVPQCVRIGEAHLELGLMDHALFAAGSDCFGLFTKREHRAALRAYVVSRPLTEI